MLNAEQRTALSALADHYARHPDGYGPGLPDPRPMAAAVRGWLGAAFTAREVSAAQVDAVHAS